MRFNCGLTVAEKNKLARQKAQAEFDRLHEWHSFFCLLPRQIKSGLCVWLETIERKGEWHEGYRDPDWWTWEFRVK